MVISIYIVHFPCETSWNSLKNITLSVFFFDIAKQKISKKLKSRLLTLTLTLTLKAPLVPQTPSLRGRRWKREGKGKKVRARRGEREEKK